MKELSQQLLQKAQEAIRTAQTLLRDQSNDFAAGRTYDAMFYIAEALLNEKDLRFSKHGGVHGAFGEHYVKTGLFDARYHRWLLDSFDQRIRADYDVGITFSSDEVQEIIQQAGEFLQAALSYLESQG